MVFLFYLFKLDFPYQGQQEAQVDAHLFLNVFGSISQEYFLKALGLICDNSPDLTPNTLHKDESGHSISAAVCRMNHLFITFLFAPSPSRNGLLSAYYFFFSYCEISELSKPVNHLQHYFYKPV